jgi:vitamin B12 transporter
MRKSVRCKIFLSGVFSGIFFLTAPAQSDSARLLPQVQVRTPAFHPAGFHYQQADSIPLGQYLPVTDYLRWSNTFQIRPSAPGTLTSISARGMNPVHTAIIWHGVNLQNPMSAIFDAQLLSVAATESLETMPGGQSTMYGSGAIGGAVVIRERPFTPDANAPWRLGAACFAGSFGYLEGQATCEVAGEKWQYKGSVQQKYAQNNFPFENTTQIGRPRVRQRNNAGRVGNLHQTLRWQIRAGHSLDAFWWRQRAFREVPPVMTATPKDSWQSDNNDRLLVQWGWQTSARSYLRSRVAWLDEQLAFHLPGDTDTSDARTLVWQEEYTFFIQKKLQWHGYFHYYRQKGRADGYADTSRWYLQRRPAVGTALSWTPGRFQWNASLRQEWLDDQSAPLTWVVSGKYQRRWWFLETHLSRNFRWATFNDRFWQGYGQPDLLPENGYSADVGVGSHWQGQQFQLNIFSILTDNWILWAPGSDGIFRPGNLRQVWSRGVEMDQNGRFRHQKTLFRYGAGYKFTRTTNTEVYQGGAEILGKQLIYVPVHSAHAWVSAQWQGLTLMYRHQYTGQRFFSTDNQQALRGFHTGAVQLEYSWGDRPGWRVFALADNCWDRSYQFFQFQPMPGFNWRTGICCTFAGKQP